ncbi:hypothetical protein EYF80_013027 [Liparis tanakae]|uniref:Uncharacterized protein n=1 Tax=Liparis tanakae TaxID=230148 RepID=A0A4Z2IFQ3_9TELE|nr:hypothetical protein EYF80_013027 [Liparis tanakae]
MDGDNQVGHYEGNLKDKVVTLQEQLIVVEVNYRKHHQPNSCSAPAVQFVELLPCGLLECTAVSSLGQWVQSSTSRRRGSRRRFAGLLRFAAENMKLDVLILSNSLLLITLLLQLQHVSSHCPPSMHLRALGRQSDQRDPSQRRLTGKEKPQVCLQNDLTAVNTS